MLTYNPFFRANVVRMVGHLTRETALADITELPVQSVVHIADGFDATGTVPPHPDIEAPLWNISPLRKTLAFQNQMIGGTEATPTMPFFEQDKGIKPPIRQVMRDLQLFRRNMRSTVRFVTSPDELVQRVNWQAVICYNRLFDYRPVGVLAKYRHWTQIMGTILNRVVANDQVMHFIDIPIGNNAYPWGAFIRVFDKITLNTLGRHQDSAFFFLVHLLSFLQAGATTSMFNRLPDNSLGRVHFFIHNKTHAVIYRLDLLQQFAETIKPCAKHVLKQLNQLTQAIDQPVIDLSTDRSVASETKEAPAPEVQPVAQVNEATATPVPQQIDTVAEQQPLDGEEAPLEKAKPNQEEVRQVEPLPPESSLKSAPLGTATEPEKSTIPATEPSATQITEPTQIVEQTELPLTVISTDSAKMNIAAYNGTDEHVVSEVVKGASADLTALAEAGQRLIDNSPSPLTAPQQKFILNVANRYNVVPLPNGRSIGEALRDGPLPELPVEHLSGKGLDQIIDRSMLASSIAKFDTAYFDQAFDRDLARTLTAFNLHGMFLTGLKYVDQIDPANRIRHYTAQYTHSNHRTHTIKFSFPIVDERGMCLVGGVTTLFKKQRLNNPIAVSGPTRVSMATNFNKTIVEMNAGTAHTFYPYFMKLAESAGFRSILGGAPNGETFLFIGFPEAVHADVEKLYRESRPIYTIRFGEAMTTLMANGTPEYLQTKFGPVRVAELEIINSIDEYAYKDGLTKEQLALYGQQKRLLVLGLEPITLPIVFASEYSELAMRCSRLTRPDTSWCFLYSERLTTIDPRYHAAALEAEPYYGIFIGTTDGTTHGCFLGADGRLAIVDLERRTLIETTTLIDKVCQLGNVSSTPLTEYAELKILNKSLPVAFVLCYKYGLTGVLKLLKCRHWIVGKGSRVPAEVPASAVRLKFADRTLVIPRTPVVPYRILAGLSIYNFANVNMADMDDQDVYFSLIQQKRLSTNYLKGIDAFFDLFCDPISIDVLRQMGEPTNVRDLLIRAVALCSTHDHLESGSSRNTRIRSYERFVGILYNEMARAFATFINRSLGARSKFSIPPTAVLIRIMTDQLMQNVDTINPIHDIKLSTGLSHLGDGGRSAQTFMIDDRRFVPDNIGVISEATVDSGKVSINVMTSMNPKLDTIRGMSTGVPADEAQPAQILSVTGLLFPGITQDDCKRANFVNIQRSHVVGTKRADLFPVRTGYERKLAHDTGYPFSIIAEEDGTVLTIDEKLEIVTIEYKSGRRKVFAYGHQVSANTGNGFYLDQEVKLNDLAAGNKFSKYDVLAYNPRFFAADPFSRQVDYKLGRTANVALVEIDQTLEDSSIISRQLSDDLEFGPINVRTISLNKQSAIHEVRKPGEHVDVNAPLIVFDEGTMPDIKASDEALAMLRTMNQTAPIAKYGGEIVDVQVVYRCEHNEMSPTVVKLVETVERRQQSRARAARGSESELLFSRPGPVKTVDRVDGTFLGDDNIIVRFFIQHDVSLEGGSKLIYGPSLKSVVARVVPEPMIATDGTVVDAVMSYRSVQARIVNSLAICGMAAKIMGNLQTEVLQRYFGPTNSSPTKKG